MTSDHKENNEQKILDIALSYFDALHQKDYDRVRKLALSTMIFEDPTAYLIDVVIEKAESLEEFILYLQKFNTGSGGKVAVNKAYKSGKHVILYVTYQSTDADGTALGAPGQSYSFECDGVTVLKIEDGKVVNHTDYVDYESILNQFNVDEK